MSVIVFLMMSFTGDPAFMVAPVDATDAEIAPARCLLGLDQSLLVRHWKFIASLLQADFGNSYGSRHPAMTLIFERMLSTVAMVLAIVIAIPLGVSAG